MDLPSPFSQDLELGNMSASPPPPSPGDQAPVGRPRLDSATPTTAMESFDSGASSRRLVPQMSPPSRARGRSPKHARSASSAGTVTFERERSRTPEPRDALPSTFNVLENFGQVVSHGEAETERIQRMKEREARASISERPIKAIHQQLRAWAEQHERWQKVPWHERLYKTAPTTQRPSKEDLIALAKHHYPPRCDALAMIYDIGDNKTDLQRIPVGQVEEYWQEKPDWAVIRWIHVPFGRGVAHSSIEDLFLHFGREEGETSRGRPFRQSGYATWPYLQTEMLYLRSRDNFERMRDTFLLLFEMDSLKEELNKTTFANDHNDKLREDMEWRAGHVASSLDFWTLAQTDMPDQLSEGGGISQGNFSMYKHSVAGPVRGLKRVERDYERQAFCKHPFFRDCQLTRNDFRGFHRKDGYLLTMSAANGVDFLDKDLNSYLQIPPSMLHLNPDATAIGRCVERFRKTGVSTWHRRSVEWLLVYIITECATTPHNMNQGGTAPDLSETYKAIVDDLKRRRYDPWKRNETIDLVREFLEASDEISVVHVTYKNKVSLFKGLIVDCERMEAEDSSILNRTPDNPAGESMITRAQMALQVMEQEEQYLTHLLEDLKQSLEALFQLRSIEQNELAIIADSQNKAVLLFTGVTVIFLPLSFFTSYFGMNLTSIRNTNKGEGYFWEVCGSVAFVMVAFTLAYALRSRITSKRSLRSDEQQGHLRYAN